MRYGDVARSSATTETPQPSTTYKPEGQSEPLWWRILSQEHMVALVRMFGHRELSIEEARTQMKELVERYGKDIMVAAAEEIVEQDGRGKVQIARLTERARNLAVQLIGRAPKAEPLPSATNASPTSAVSDSESDLQKSEALPPVPDGIAHPAVASNDQAVSPRNSIDEPHLVVEADADVAVPPPVRRTRKEVVPRFLQSLEFRGVPFDVVDAAKKKELKGEQLGTLDYIVYEEGHTELITIRRTLTPLQRHDMLAWLGVAENEAKSYRIWPHEDSEGQWSWFWYPIEERTRDGRIASDENTERRAESDRPSTGSCPQTSAISDGATELPDVKDDDLGVEEDDEAEKPPEEHVQHSAATALEVEGEPVNLPREAVMTRFVASLDALNMDFGVPDDETKAELHGEHLGTLDYFIDAAGETELVTVRPLVTDQERHEMLAWSELFDATPMAAFRVWPHEKDGRWTWYWYPIAEGTGKTEPDGTQPAESDVSHAMNDVRQGGSGQPENTKSVDEPDGADIGKGETQPPTRGSSVQPSAASCERAASRLSTIDEPHVIVESDAEVVVPRPVRLRRKDVLPRFLKSLEIQELPFEVIDAAKKRELGGEQLGTLDYIVYEAEMRELVTIRRTLTALQRRDMVAWAKVVANEATCYRVWPHEDSEGQWSWFWYPIEQQFHEQTVAAEEGGQPVAKGDQPHVATDETNIQSDAIEATSVEAPAIDEQQPATADQHKCTDLSHVSHRLDLLAEDLEAITEKHRQDGEVLQGLRDELDALRWQLDRALRPETETAGSSERRAGD